jgi:hypothetical protein
MCLPNYNALGLTESPCHAANIGSKNQHGSLLYAPYMLFHLTSEQLSSASSNLMAGAGMLSVLKREHDPLHKDLVPAV